MPQVKNTPEQLKPFVFHGVDIDATTREEAVAACPFCGREGKFYVSVGTGQYSCKVCMEQGNAVTFLRKLWEQSWSDTSSEDYETLAADRDYLSTDGLMEWGVCKSMLTGEWLVPGYSADGRLTQLYRYVKMGGAAGGKPRLLATPNFNQQLHGVTHFDPNRSQVWIAEGVWDGVALWEMLRKVRKEDGQLVFCEDVDKSLASEVNILAVPGCGVFLDTWAPLLTGKDVTLLYHNDHPRTNQTTGKIQEPVGTMAMRRAAGITSACGPRSLQYLNWGTDGYDPELKDGYDLRDCLGEATADEWLKPLNNVLGRVCDVPAEWAKKGEAVDPRAEIECLPCSEWKVLVESWRRAMKWTPGLDRALSFMLAVITSTKAIGDQLWGKIISPPSGGKSTLCEALSVNKKYTLAKSTIRGFHSGFKSDKAGEEDHSLISLVSGKTLITKDGDSLLQAPNLGQILAEARDLYDSTSRTHYRHGLKRDYEGVRMTWLLCGTSSLRQLDSSELGERFLDCVIMEGIDEELEDEVLWRIANRTERNMKYEADGKMETQHDVDMVEAMRLTGGYVSWLRGNASSLLAGVTADDVALKQCVRLGKFVAFMRARPSKVQDETAEREFASRLVSQIVRLAKCTAVVLNRKTIDEEVLRRCTQVALDTARGRTLEVARNLRTAGQVGMASAGLAVLSHETDDKTLTLLRFLRKIGVCEVYSQQIAVGLKGQNRWRLTASLQKLYDQVMGEPVVPVEEEVE